LTGLLTLISRVRWIEPPPGGLRCELERMTLWITGLPTLLKRA
jgi:hypothetical protein